MADAPDQRESAARPFVLGIIGDSGSGKSTIARGVRALIGPEQTSALELDDYHRFSRAERQEKGMTALNPAVHDLRLMHEHLQMLRRGRQVRNRRYDHTDGSFGPVRTLTPGQVVIARGLLGFPTEELRAAYDLAVFVHPETDLLFRWKLRRDVKTRGYSEAEVLKHIAQHLLDSKEYVLPQAERADLVIRYTIPDWESPDSEVRTTLVVRRAAADAVRGLELDRFEGRVTTEECEGYLGVHLDPALPRQVVDAWGAERFPETYAPDAVGAYNDEEGSDVPSGPLAFTQTLIADLTRRMERAQDEAGSEAAAAV